MNRIVILVLVLLLPNSIAEMSHSPKEVSEGETFTALIDTEEDVVSVTFYVCTLEEPYTCYKPVKQNREDTVNGRFEFTYEVKSNDYPGYKYEVENEDNSTENIPASEYSYYDGMNVVKMQDSYYFKVDVKSQEERDDSLLYAPNLILTIAIMAIIALTSRK